MCERNAICLDRAIQVVGEDLLMTGCRCLKSCQDVAVACRTDLCNSLLSCTIYTTPETPVEEVITEVTSCLDAFLTGEINERHSQMSPNTVAQSVEQAGILPTQNQAGSDSSDVANNRDTAAIGEACTGDDSCADDVSIDADAIDDYLKPPAMHRHWQPLVLVIGVPALPKGALVEVQPEAFTVDAITQLASSSSSSGSSDDDGTFSADARDINVDVQRDGNRMQGWAGQLQHSQSMTGGQRGLNWHSLMAPGIYCCCQISFGVSDDLGTLRDSVQAAVTAATERLQVAGLAAKHVMHACIYAQLQHQNKTQQVKNMWDDVWQAHHGAVLPIPVIPVSYIFSSLGCQVQQVEQPQVCLLLTAQSQ